MTKSIQIVFAIFLVAVVLIQSGAALKCWNCNSGENANCADKFDPEDMSEVQRRYFYVECPSIPLQVLKINGTMKQVCKKLITRVADKRIFSRSCFYESVDKPKDSCKMDHTVPFIEVEFCESCDGADGCNGGSYLVPMTIVPVALITLLKQMLF